MKRRKRAQSLPREQAQLIDSIARRSRGVSFEPFDDLDDDGGGVEVLPSRSAEGVPLHRDRRGREVLRDQVNVSRPHTRSYRRDVEAFEQRAPTYDRGFVGRLHREIDERTADLALSSGPAPSRVLDVGCGTGNLLRLLAKRCPQTIEFAGIDPALAMISIARVSADDRVSFAAGNGAENLPFDAATFDVVTATTSFDHWFDQRSGLHECARVLAPGGRLILVDQFSYLLSPTLAVGRRKKARTKRRATKLLRSAGFAQIEWHPLYGSSD